ncbi:PP2C family protein-serine/threonine phosphatase [Butyrivibrio sp. AE2032]|uniref:PP2C family protein-serine/threonine phosphatase n=1 Tax=Butyrivibrio sp. AE2032 TaxID=1458463 RepID=UPI00068B3D3E|nr:PP2C family protein-serine/threonine phosphatase [Butyrivibrio sp. AE2032]
MENTEKKKSSRNQKILIQTGVVIIILFTLMTIAVGNMITMSAFSTSLNSNMKMFEKYMDSLGDNLNEYKSLTWLMDYWKANSESMITEDDMIKKVDDIDEILDKLSKKRGADILPEEAESLTSEEQLDFAIYAYNQFSEVMKYYQGENEDFAIIIAMTGENDEEPVAILTNYPDEEALIGKPADLPEIQKIIDNTRHATRAKVWQWAFTTPSDAMMFGTNIPFLPYSGADKAEYFGIFTGELVYADMDYTNSIRNSVIAMMILVFILLLLFLYYIVPRPLAKLKKYVSEYSESKDTDKLVKELSAIRSHNEIGAFADQFSDMAQEMERYTKEMEHLAAEKERVETELNVAQNIQMSMLPHTFPESEDFRLSASMTPAKEVGGDFYDCYMIDDDHMALTIADVSGKGVPASLFMAVSKTMLKNRTLVGGKPSEILADVNNWLCEGNDSCMFVTVWHSILTISTGELICANAGHENPGIRSGDGTFRLIRTEHGMMLGAMEDLTFTDEYYTLNPGDALFVYTDGVPEANNMEEKMFGEDKLESVLSTVMSEDTPQDVMKKVRSAVDVFAGAAPQYDDLTMLCLVMNPKTQD